MNLNSSTDKTKVIANIAEILERAGHTQDEAFKLAEQGYANMLREQEAQITPGVEKLLGSLMVAARRAIRSYHMSNMVCAEDGLNSPYPLVDLLSTDGESIATGEYEIDCIVDAIYLDARETIAHDLREALEGEEISALTKGKLKSISDIDAIWEEATLGNHGEATKDVVRWFAKALLAHPDTEKFSPNVAEIARDALDTCRTMADSNNDGISFKASDKAIEAIDSGAFVTITPVDIPKLAPDNSNLEEIGRAKGWNAACAILGRSIALNVNNNQG